MARGKRPLFFRVIGRVLSIMLSLLLAVVVYLSLVLSQPQQENQPQTLDLTQPLLPASPAQSIQEEGQLYDLISAFPVEVLCATISSGYTLENGSAYDASFEQGAARIIHLEYSTAGGALLAVDSIYPVRALSVLQYGGYHISAAEGCSVAGYRSVRMENSEFVRLHFQTPDGLYAVTVPRASAPDLATLVRPLQLLEVN